MGHVTIDISELPEAVRACLLRGESVQVEDGGRVVAHVEPQSRPNPGTPVDWEGYLAARRAAPPLDDEFEKDMEKVWEVTNRPVAPVEWEP